ncbi:MAG TPA: ABC transporter permease [Dehalococcoidia bacterium]|nr:ABC transporter permease [Dehalococcoidia bacterium]
MLQDTPVGNVPYRYAEELRQDPRAGHVTALALGDNVSGVPLIGVDQQFFQLLDPALQQPYFQVGTGRLFHNDGEVSQSQELTFHQWEAVPGAHAGRRWGTDTTFQSQHGAAGEVATGPHDTYYSIVGILEPTDTPLDRAIFVPLESYWYAHAEGGLVGEAEMQVTAIMARPIGIQEFYQLHQEINQDVLAQAALTGQGMARLFDLLGQGQRMLTQISYVALIMGSATVFLVSYAVSALRLRDAAILRALGASRWSVSTIALAEALAVGVLGILVGMLLGHAAAWLIASGIQETSAIAVTTSFQWAELTIGCVVLLLAAAAALLPAVQSYSQDAAAHLAAR